MLILMLVLAHSPESEHPDHQCPGRWDGKGSDCALVLLVK